MHFSQLDFEEAPTPLHLRSRRASNGQTEDSRNIKNIHGFGVLYPTTNMTEVQLEIFV